MISKCRVCGGDLIPVLQLGDFYLSDFLKPDEEAVKDDLIMAQCSKCELHQLYNIPDLDFMYKDHYWYRSGLNSSMLKDLQDIVTNVESRIQLQDGDVVVDIGANDGSMLNMYTNKNLYRIGFDPAPNLREKAEKNCELFVNDYFSSTLYPPDAKKAKVVTSIAMFYDLPDPNKFIQEVAEIMDESGVWVIQLMDLFSLLKTNGIDSLNSEHLEYYKLSDLHDLMYFNGFEIFDCEYNKVNGGSLRIYVGFRGKHTVEQRFYDRLSEEEGAFYSGEVSIQKLIHNVDIIGKKVKAFLSKFGVEETYALAASTKANTALQIFKLDSSWIKAIGEVNEDKFGLRTSGTNIPIVPEKEVLDRQPKVIIVLAWHFTETFAKVLKNYLEKGGLVLYMFPWPYVVTDNGGFNL